MPDTAKRIRGKLCRVIISSNQDRVEGAANRSRKTRPNKIAKNPIRTYWIPADWLPVRRAASMVTTAKNTALTPLNTSDATRSPSDGISNWPSQFRELTVTIPLTTISKAIIQAKPAAREIWPPACCFENEAAVIGATNTKETAVEARKTVGSRNSNPFHQGTTIPNPTTAIRKETTVVRCITSLLFVSSTTIQESFLTTQ